MKEQLKSAILPPLPIVGTLKLTTRDGEKLSAIDVVNCAPDKTLGPFFRECFKELEAFLTGKQKKIRIKLDIRGLSHFQQEVLKAMKEIPYGKVATYKEIAKRINSKGYQAIGSACGKNPFMLIYPCHRVIGSNSLGGFAHGLPMKKKLLELEGHSS